MESYSEHPAVMHRRALAIIQHHRQGNVEGAAELLNEVNSMEAAGHLIAVLAAIGAFLVDNSGAEEWLNQALISTSLAEGDPLPGNDNDAQSN